MNTLEVKSHLDNTIRDTLGTLSEHSQIRMNEYLHHLVLVYDSKTNQIALDTSFNNLEFEAILNKIKNTLNK